LPEVFDHAQVGDAIHFDDGRISGRVVSVDRDVLTVHIDHPRLGAALAAVPAVPILMLLLPMPQSPRWYMLKGRVVPARRVLQYMQPEASSGTLPRLPARSQKNAAVRSRRCCGCPICGLRPSW
jgi:hypothetical protein